MGSNCIQKIFRIKSMKRDESQEDYLEGIL